MKIHIHENPQELGQQAGTLAADLIRAAISEKGQANVILATGTSQFETLRQLVAAPDIDWSKVVLFHLDEYLGLPQTHPASFRKYLSERFLEQVPPLQAVFLINGEAPDAQQECQRLGTFIEKYPIDVALVGIGENGHLAFNDPPADFETEQPYLVVNLDEPCRQQQLGEGWFGSLAEVPAQAISMSVRQILKSKNIICSVPDARKALAVKNCLEQPVSNQYPASVLRTHAACWLFLDRQSAGLLADRDTAGAA
jgi:glucosamine-6-phosphate deaminase